jgi:hypothetical protein
VLQKDCLRGVVEAGEWNLNGKENDICIWLNI